MSRTGPVWRAAEVVAADDYGRVRAVVVSPADCGDGVLVDSLELVAYDHDARRRLRPGARFRLALVLEPDNG